MASPEGSAGMESLGERDSGQDDSQIRLAFLDWKEFDGGKVIRGGILVTDELTKPLEFRCTSPVSPDAFQKILYGDSLMPHIAVRLIAGPLVNALRESPEVVIVRREMLLEAQPELPIPIFRLLKQAQVADAGLSDEEVVAGTIQCSTGRFEAVIVQTHRERPADVGEKRAKLSNVLASRDLLEPFERVSQALDQVHAQKVADK